VGSNPAVTFLILKVTNLIGRVARLQRAG
jgi:hypothetical protein